MEIDLPQAPVGKQWYHRQEFVLIVPRIQSDKVAQFYSEDRLEGGHRFCHQRASNATKTSWLWRQICPRKGNYPTRKPRASKFHLGCGICEWRPMCVQECVWPVRTLALDRCARRVSEAKMAKPSTIADILTVRKVLCQAITVSTFSIFDGFAEHKLAMPHLSSDIVLALLMRVSTHTFGHILAFIHYPQNLLALYLLLRQFAFFGHNCLEGRDVFIALYCFAFDEEVCEIHWVYIHSKVVQLWLDSFLASP